MGAPGTDRFLGWSFRLVLPSWLALPGRLYHFSSHLLTAAGRALRWALETGMEQDWQDPCPGGSSRNHSTDGDILRRGSLWGWGGHPRWQKAAALQGEAVPAQEEQEPICLHHYSLSTGFGSSPRSPWTLQAWHNLEHPLVSRRV